RASRAPPPRHSCARACSRLLVLLYDSLLLVRKAATIVPRASEVKNVPVRANAPCGILRWQSRPVAGATSGPERRDERSRTEPRARRRDIRGIPSSVGHRLPAGHRHRDRAGDRSSASAQAPPKEGGVLKVGMIGEPPTLDQHATTAVITREIGINVFE